MNVTNGLTPVILYNSAGMPIGSRALIPFYRPPSAADTTGSYPAGYTAPSVAAIVPFGQEGTAVLLGAYLIETIGMNMNGNELSRTGVFGEDLGDGSLVRGKITLSA